MTDPIVKEIEVPCSADIAFDVFVNKSASWWPLDKHSVSSGSGNVAQSVVIEPRQGGAVYEIMFDGSRSDWGQVTRFEEGRVLGLSWNPGGSASADTLVEVTFEDTGNGQARVILTHSGWEALGDKADDMRAGYNQGWVRVFEDRYRDAVPGKVK